MAKGKWWGGGREGGAKRRVEERGRGRKERSKGGVWKGEFVVLSIGCAERKGKIKRVKKNACESI